MIFRSCFCFVNEVKEDSTGKLGDISFGVLVCKISNLDHNTALRISSPFINDEEPNQRDWYGFMNFLGEEDADNILMRVESTEIVAELLEMTFRNSAEIDQQTF